jgi:hypothetical protein
LIAPEWLWIPVTIAAALAQTGRNAAQRQAEEDLHQRQRAHIRRRLDGHRC